MLPKPNCCKRPHLHVIQIVEEASDQPVAIFRCDACETYWQAANNAFALREGAFDDVEGFQKLSTDDEIKMLRTTR
jgi:hypothetical protein